MMTPGQRRQHEQMVAQLQEQEEAIAVLRGQVLTLLDALEDLADRVTALEKRRTRTARKKT